MKNLSSTLARPVVNQAVVCEEKSGFAHELLPLSRHLNAEHFSVPVRATIERMSVLEIIN